MQYPERGEPAFPSALEYCEDRVQTTSHSLILMIEHAIPSLALGVLTGCRRQLLVSSDSAYDERREQIIQTPDNY